MGEPLSAARKACPFCGGRDTTVDKELRDGYEDAKDDPDAYAYSLRCLSCAATGGWSKSDGGAVRWWQMRSRPDRRAFPVPTSPPIRSRRR